MATATQSFVTSASAAANTVAMPAGTRQGDLIIVVAHRSAVTAPSLPAGWTNIANGSGNTNSYRVGFKAANGASDTTGTWTNATNVQVYVIRGAGGIGTVSAATKAAATTANVPTLALKNTDGSSWVLAFAASNQVVAQGTPLAGATTLRGTQASATDNLGIFDTNGGVASFAATTSANNSSVVSCGGSIEILAALPPAHTLRDTFDTNTLDATKWGTFTDAGSTVANVNQEIEISNAASAGYGALLSKSFFSLYGSYVATQLIDAGNQALSLDAIPVYIVDSQVSELNNLLWEIESNNMFALYVLNGAQTTAHSGTTYNSAIHKFFRIRESSGTIFWDFSTDGISWTNYASITTATFTYGLISFQIGMQGGIFTTPGTSTSKYDNFNVLPTPPQGYVKISNRYTGPMALRYLFRQPYIPSGNVVQATPTGYSAGLFGGAYFGQAYFADAWGALGALATNKVYELASLGVG